MKRVLPLSFATLMCAAFCAVGENAATPLRLNLEDAASATRWQIDTKELKAVNAPAGKAILVGQDEGCGRSVKLNPGKSFSAGRGTISFWVSPVDWTGDDNAYHHFFEATGSDARMIIYKHADGKKLLFLVGPNGAWTSQTAVEAEISDWKRSSWHHVGCSWDAVGLKLYVDGELRASMPIHIPPRSTFSEFRLGAMPGYWGEINGASLVSDFTLRDSTAKPTDIFEEYVEGLRRRAIPTRGGLETASVAKTANAPALDGVVKPWEYSFAGTGFIDVQTGVFSNYQSRFSLSYDDQNIYFGMISSAHDKMVSNVKDRDGLVWQDDSAEIFLAPAGGADYYHFILNANDAVYDEMNRSRKDEYNAELQTVNKIDGGVWTLETKIPFRFLGGKTPRPGDTWRFTVCRSYPALNKYTSVSNVRDMYDNPDGFGALRFEGQNGLSFAVDSFGDLDKGVLDTSPEIRNPGSNGTIAAECRLFAPKGLIYEQKKMLELKAGEVRSVSFTERDIAGKSDTVQFVPTSDEGTASAKNTAGKSSVIISMHADNGVKYRQEIPFSMENAIKLKSLYTSNDKTKIVFGFEQSHISVGGNTFNGHINIIGQDGKKVAGRDFAPDNIVYSEEVDISALLAGRYIVETIFTDHKGKKVFNERRNYWIMGKEPKWKDNLVGISTAVPPPWTPLSKDGETIKCWGRTYSFGKSFMPSMIESQNMKLFAAPPSLKGIINGVAFEERNCHMKWGDVSSDKASFTTESSLGGTTVSAVVDMEYDGFLWAKISVTPSKGDKIEALSIEIPMPKTSATLVNGFDYHLNGTGKLGDYWSKNLKHRPIFWVGNETAGFQWFAESLSGWRFENPQKGVEIVSAGTSRLVKLNIVDCPTDEKLDFAFGLQATPVKSRISLWRDLRCLEEDKIRDPRENLSLWSIAFQTYSYPELTKLAKGTVEKLGMLHSKGVKVCPYLGFQAASPTTPEFMYYGEAWRKEPEARTPVPTIEGCASLDNEYKELLSRVCAGSSQYRDFLLWKLDGVLDKVAFDGLYFDWAQVNLCNNSLHGCGWRDHKNGPQVSFAILGARELAKRIYCMAKTKNPKATIVHHMSGEIAIPVQSFCDLMIDGENFNGDVLAKEKNYFKSLSLDQFRAESLPWGPVPVFLPEFGNACFFFDKTPDKYAFWKTQEAQGGVKHLLGMILVHDSLCWPAWASGFHWMFPSNPMREIWDAQDKFGWRDDLEFHPYWESAKVVEFEGTPPEGVVVSSYFNRKAGRLLLIPFNNTDKEVSAELRINLDKLGAGLSAATSAEDLRENTPVPLKDDKSLALKLNARSFKLISAHLVP